MRPSAATSPERKSAWDRCAYRLSAPGLGQEVGANLGLMPSLYQGFFLAPNVVSGAVKGAVFTAAVYESLGFRVVPAASEERHDIIQCVELKSPEGMLAFCKGIQSATWTAMWTPRPRRYARLRFAGHHGGGCVRAGQLHRSARRPIRPPTRFTTRAADVVSRQLGVLLSLQKMLDAGAGHTALTLYCQEGVLLC